MERRGGSRAALAAFGAAVAVLLGLALPAAASAAVHVSIEERSAPFRFAFTEITGDGGPQDLSISAPDPGRITVSNGDGVVLDESNVPCQQQGPNQLTCEVGGVHLDIDSGGGSDRVVVEQSYAALSVAGGPGNDTLQGAGSGSAAGGTGNDTLTSFEASSGDAGRDRIDGGYAEGGRGNDTITNSHRAEGGAGDDRLLNSRFGGIALGGPGSDLLRGGNRSDDLRGGPGADTLLGRDREDALVGGPGPDRLDGGDEDDLLAAVSGDRDRSVDCGRGADEAYVDPGDRRRVSGCERKAVVRGVPALPPGVLDR